MEEDGKGEKVTKLQQLVPHQTSTAFVKQPTKACKSILNIFILFTKSESCQECHCTPTLILN